MDICLDQGPDNLHPADATAIPYYFGDDSPHAKTENDWPIGGMTAYA